MKVLDLLSWFGPIHVFVGAVKLDRLVFFRFFNRYKLLCCCCCCCCACALDCNGFWRLWLDSHGLCVIVL